MPDISLNEKRRINQRVTVKGFRIPETDNENNILLDYYLKLSDEQQKESQKIIYRLREPFGIPEYVTIYPLPSFFGEK